MRKFLYLLLLFAILLLAGCGRRDPAPEKIKPAPDVLPVQTRPGEPRLDLEAVAPGRELLRSVDSLEEAERLAECYGITLVDYIDGLAVFTTEEDPRDVIQRGRDNGWPELSRNSVQKLS
jgi:hypothetical protein